MPRQRMMQCRNERIDRGPTLDDDILVIDLQVSSYLHIELNTSTKEEALRSS